MAKDNKQITKRVQTVRDLLALADAQLGELQEVLQDTSAIYSEVLERREEIEEKLANSVRLLTDLIRRGREK
jgi:hypothetical protein